jgi:hypothetical protein
MAARAPACTKPCCCDTADPGVAPRLRWLHVRERGAEHTAPATVRTREGRRICPQLAADVRRRSACGPQAPPAVPFAKGVLRFRVAMIAARRDVLATDPRVERGVRPGDFGRVAHCPAAHRFDVGYPRTGCLRDFEASRYPGGAWESPAC